jgi:hypothetical protein
MKWSARQETQTVFKALVSEVNDVLMSRAVNDDTLWELARRLHDTWHRVMARLEDEDANEQRETERRHPALAELLRLIDIEEGP